MTDLTPNVPDALDDDDQDLDDMPPRRRRRGIYILPNLFTLRCSAASTPS
jgi:hypothetical protein